MSMILVGGSFEMRGFWLMVGHWPEAAQRELLAGVQFL
jgi:hypothetical protein